MYVVQVSESLYLLERSFYASLWQSNSRSLLLHRPSSTSMPTLRVIRPVPTGSNANVSVINGLCSAIAVAPLDLLLTENVTCFMCLLENCHTNDPHIVPECLHSFCGDCLKEWIRMFGNECPTCKVDDDTRKSDLSQDSKPDNVSASI